MSRAPSLHVFSLIRPNMGRAPTHVSESDVATGKVFQLKSFRTRAAALRYSVTAARKIPKGSSSRPSGSTHLSHPSEQGPRLRTTKQVLADAGGRRVTVNGHHIWIPQRVGR